MKKKILIDTDPGHDDAIAIMTMLAAADSFEILGITTVAGNQTLDKVTRNMLKILELTRSKIPLAPGARKPLTRELETGGDAHGDSGMDGPVLPEPGIQPLGEEGAAFLYEQISQSNSPVTILALGPLTNIANLIARYPSVKAAIQEISLMGGGLDRGNITETAEFNIYVDPEAADIVFQSGLNITMSGLDVTEKALIFPQEWAPLHSRGKASKFTAELLDFYYVSSKRFGFDASALHDACAAVWLMEPSLFRGEMLPVRIETKGVLTRGMTVADRRRIPQSSANIRVLLDVDRDKFTALILDRLARLDRMIDGLPPGPNPV